MDIEMNKLVLNMFRIYLRDCHRKLIVLLLLYFKAVTVRTIITMHIKHKCSDELIIFTLFNRKQYQNEGHIFGGWYILSFSCKQLSEWDKKNIQTSWLSKKKVH